VGGGGGGVGVGGLAFDSWQVAKWTLPSAERIRHS